MLQKYSWILSQRFFFVFLIHCIKNKTVLLWLALLVLLLPRTPKKKEGTRQKNPTKQKLKALSKYGILISSLDHGVGKSRQPSDPISHFCLTALKAQKPMVTPRTRRGASTRHSSDTPWAPQRLIVQGELPSALNFHFVLKSKTMHTTGLEIA